MHKREKRNIFWFLNWLNERVREVIFAPVLDLFRGGPFNKYKLLAKVKLHLSGNLITNDKNRQVIADQILIHISNEAAKAAGALKAVEAFIAKEVVKYARDCGYELSLEPRVKITGLTMKDKYEHRIKGFITPSPSLPTLIDIALIKFSWSGGSKEIRAPSGSFYVGTTDSCGQRIYPPRFSGVLAYVNADEHDLKVALATKSLKAECAGIELVYKKVYKIKPGSRVNFGGVITLDYQLGGK